MPFFPVSAGAASREPRLACFQAFQANRLARLGCWAPLLGSGPVGDTTCLVSLACTPVEACSALWGLATNLQGVVSPVFFSDPRPEGVRSLSARGHCVRSTCYRSLPRAVECDWAGQGRLSSAGCSELTDYTIDWKEKLAAHTLQCAFPISVFARLPVA